MKTSSNKLFEPALVQTALKQSFIKLDPRVMIKNPVMFTVEIGTVIMAYVTIYSMSNTGQGSCSIQFLYLFDPVTYCSVCQFCRSHC